MSEVRKTLSVRDEAQRQDAPPLQGRGKGWGISASRLDNLHDHAREMRRNPTEPELKLWGALKSQQLGGVKFRRQEVIGSAIVDFACPGHHLVIEVDGDSHDNPANDARRDGRLTDHGFRVLRFTNEEVMLNLDGVLQAILVEVRARTGTKRAAARPHPYPSPEGEGRTRRTAMSPSPSGEGLGVGPRHYAPRQPAKPR